MCSVMISARLAVTRYFRRLGALSSMRLAQARPQPVSNMLPGTERRVEEVQVIGGLRRTRGRLRCILCVLLDPAGRLLTDSRPCLSSTLHIDNGYAPSHVASPYGAWVRSSQGPPSVHPALLPSIRRRMVPQASTDVYITRKQWGHRAISCKA